ncbi:KAP family P-loop NTPase fold protein [Enterococcus sp. LJL90]
MSAIKKKYFIKDTSLKSVDNDMFNYANISKVMNRIIKTNNPPYNIAVIGKWGLGKSSLINIVKGMLASDEDIMIQEINAWKYEKESLKKVFLKQLWKGISDDSSSSYQVIIKEFNKIINSQISSTTKTEKDRDIFNKWKNFGIMFLVILGLTFSGFGVYKYVQANHLDEVFTMTSVFLGYCRNIATLLFIPIILFMIKMAIDSYHEKETKKIELNFPIETVDDYELFLESTIQDKLTKNPNLKIVTIIDDLDRLSIEKIVEALDALKAFVGFKNCIFIVPFDDEIIKLALEKRRADEFDNEADIIESELILDKLFQFKIYLPPLLYFDINKYAEELVKQEAPDFINEYCSLEKFSRILKKIIIHSDVTTPRQVKKLINAFINNYMIAYEREKSHKVKSGLFTSDVGQEQIAKISVLQADFNHFYDLLFQDFNYLDKILDYQNKSIVEFKYLDNNLQEYFETQSGLLKIKNEYESLFNFLNRTRKYNVSNIAPFMYIAQDDISIQTGDKLQQRTVNALSSQNYSLLTDLLEENESLSSFINYYLENSREDIEDTIYSVIQVFDSLSGDKKMEVANTIVEKTLENYDFDFLYSVSTHNVFEVKSAASREDFANQFLDKYLLSLTSKENNERVLADSMDTIKNNWDLLSSSQKGLTKNISTLIIKNATDNPDFEIAKFENVVLSKSEIYNYLWGIEWFKVFCNYLYTTNDFSENSISHLKNVFLLLDSEESENQIANELLNLVEYPTVLPVLDELLSEEFCGNLESSISTKFAEKLVSLDYAKNSESIYSLLNKLKYEVNINNKDLFTDFTVHYVESEEMDDVLEYIGKNSKFEFIDSTINSLIDAVFRDSSNDSLLRKVIDYFSEEQEQRFVAKLTDESKKYNKESYEQENTIFSIISNKEKYIGSINIILSDIIHTVGSYYSSYPTYFDFVLILVGRVKNNLSVDNLSAFINFIKRIYVAQQDRSIQAIRSLSGVINEDQFRDIFNLLVSNAGESNYDTILNIIIDNDDVRPRDSDSLSMYRKFLVKQMSISEKPKKVLDVINNAFSNISNINELITDSLKNPNLSKKQLGEVVTKFINNMNIDNLVKLVIESSTNIENTNIIKKSLASLSKFSVEEIRTDLIEKLAEVSITNDRLMNLLEFSKVSVSSSSNKLIYTILRLAFENIDQKESLLNIIAKLNEYEEILLNDKTGTAAVLREGFTNLQSDSLRKTIVETISTLRIKREFKKGLGKDLLDFYKNNVK